MLKQKFLVQFGSNISLRILGMISGIVLARVAGPEVLGTIAYATAYVGIFGFITGLFGTGNIKLISEGKDLGDNLATYSRLQIIAIIIFFFSVLVWFAIQKYILIHQFESKIHEQVIIITLFSMVITKLIQFSDSTFTGQLKQAKANLPNIVKGILFQLGKIVVVLLGFKAVGLVSWNLLTGIIVLPIAINLFRSLPYGKYSKELAKNYLKISIPVFLIVVLNSVIAYSDKLILQHYTNSTELGYFAVAFSLGGMILILGSTMGIVFFPLFSKYIKENNWENLNNKINKFQIFLANFILPFICLLGIIAEPLLLGILGDKYQNSVIPFILMIYASYISIVGMPYGNILSGMGKFYLNFWLKLLKFLFYIISVIYFVSTEYLGLGAIGLAMNLLSVNIFHNILVIFTSRRIGKLKINYQVLLTYAVLLILVLISYLIVVPFLKDITKYWWVIFPPVFLIIVFSLLNSLNLITKKQVIQLFQIINPKLTYNYIKEEMNE